MTDKSNEVLEQRIRVLEERGIKHEKEFDNFMKESLKFHQDLINEFKNTEKSMTLQTNDLKMTMVTEIGKLVSGFEMIKKEKTVQDSNLKEHYKKIQEQDQRLTELELKVDRIWWLGGTVLALLMAAATGILQNIINSLF